MREAVIITRSRSMAPNSYMPPIDLDWLHPFKKTRADKVKEKLSHALAEERMNFQVHIDCTTGDAGELKMDGVAFYILAPMVSRYVELEQLDETEYIVLTEREYNEIDIKRIVHKMKWLDAVN